MTPKAQLILSNDNLAEAVGSYVMQKYGIAPVEITFEMQRRDRV